MEQENIKITPGKLLYDARVAANLSQENVAASLYLNVTVIRDLEADRYSASNLVFMKGYLRACGKMLNIPNDELMAAFDNLGIATKPSSLDIAPATSSQVSQVTDVKVRKTTAISALILIVIVFLVWYIHHARDKNQDTEITEETNPIVTPTVPAPAVSAPPVVVSPASKEEPKQHTVHRHTEEPGTSRSDTTAVQSPQPNEAETHKVAPGVAASSKAIVKPPQVTGAVKPGPARSSAGPKLYMDLG